MNIRLIIVLFFAFLLVHSTWVFADDANIIYETSMVTLLTKTGYYDGKIVKVAGFAMFSERRDSFLYGSAEEAEHNVDISSIALLIDAASWGQVREIKRGWIEVVGIFHDKPKTGVDSVGRPSIKLDNFAAITPLITQRQAERARMVAEIARFQTMIDIVKDGLKIPLLSELEIELKERYLDLRYYDLTGNKPYDRKK